MPEVPSYQKINAIHNGDCDMGSVGSRAAWHGSLIDQLLRQPINFLGDIKQSNTFQSRMCLNPHRHRNTSRS